VSGAKKRGNPMGFPVFVSRRTPPVQPVAGLRNQGQLIMVTLLNERRASLHFPRVSNAHVAVDQLANAVIGSGHDSTAEHNRILQHSPLTNGRA